MPIFVLTGFLGSGKTTLLNHMLKHPSLSDAAVLINEFGEIGLDHQLVEKVDENTVLLSSGCLCCTIRDDLKQAILDLHDKRAKRLVPNFQRMIVETTGLADPAPILATLMNDVSLRYHYRLGTIITTVDAVNGSDQLDRQEESVKQASVADRIVLTKMDLTDQAEIEKLRNRLERINPSAEFLVADHGVVDVEQMLRADVYDPATKGAEVLRWIEAEMKRESELGGEGAHHVHSVNRHDARIHSFCLIYEDPIDWTAFGIWLTMLLHTHGQDILRVKGMLNVKNVDTPVVLNGVQHIIHPPMHLDAWPDADRRSRIVFIVRDLTKAQIMQSLAVFNRLHRQ
jgi:G3E family GTPase